MEGTDIYAKLFRDCFQDDPGIKMQLSDTENANDILFAFCKGEVEAYEKLGCLSHVEHDGLLIAYPTELTETAAFGEALNGSTAYLLQAATQEELISIQNNALKLSEIVEAHWYLKFTKDTPVYLLHAVMVRREMKGKGILRKLLTPVFERCAAEKRAIALQTHKKELLPIYEHFGFALMETVTSDQFDISCYNMLKTF